MDNTDRYMQDLFGETLEEIDTVKRAAWGDVKSQQHLNNRKASPRNNLAKLIHFLKFKKNELDNLEVQDHSEEIWDAHHSGESHGSE